MTAGNYYDLTALPALGELGSTPPLKGQQLLEHLADSPNSRALVEVLFLLHDLLQREAFLSGETQQVSPTVLMPGQVRNEEPMPEYLTTGEEQAPRAVEADRLREAYFRHAAGIAGQLQSAFLGRWIGYEVSLRNALASERAGKLGLEAADYLVATDLADADEDFSEVISQWTSAETPLAGLRVLIQARWSYLVQHDAWFTFKDDELAAYAAKLMLLDQWYRLTQAGVDDPASVSGGQRLEYAERTDQ